MILEFGRRRRKGVCTCKRKKKLFQKMRRGGNRGRKNRAKGQKRKQLDQFDLALEKWRIKQKSSSPSPSPFFVLPRNRQSTCSCSPEAFSSIPPQLLSCFISSREGRGEKITTLNLPPLPSSPLFSQPSFNPNAVVKEGESPHTEKEEETVSPPFSW